LSLDRKFDGNLQATGSTSGGRRRESGIGLKRETRRDDEKGKRRDAKGNADKAAGNAGRGLRHRPRPALYWRLQSMAADPL